MGFLMDGLGAESYDREYPDVELLRRIVDHFRPVGGMMVVVAVMVVLNSLMDTILPIAVARGVDVVFDEASLSALPGALGRLTADQALIAIVLVILASGALSWTFNFLRQILTARAVGDVVLALREEAFDAVMARDMSFYDATPSGRVVSRVTSDTQDFANVVTLSLNLISQVLLVVLISGVLFLVNARLALLALLIAPLIVVAALGFRKIARTTTTEARRILAIVNSTVQETIRGIGVAKSFRQERAVYDAFLDVNRESYRVTLRQGFVFSSIFPILNTIAGLGTAIVLWSGGQRVLDGTISAGEWYLFVQAIALFWFPLTGIASFWSQFQLGLAASERVFSLIDAEPQVRQTAAEDPGPLVGRVAFRGVDFHYVPGEPVLRNFDLTIPAGQTLALVGHTGAGKSSIAKLVARFYEFQGGRLEVDGRDIRRLDLAAYRRQLGIVPQAPVLFTGTVADNIRYARPDATDEQLAAAAAAVGGGDWMAALPQGLSSRVGERGQGLSMGQRQLVVLARLMLQDPAILVLDEATASIDPLTEAQIQEGLDALMAERTAIIIAHRLSTIRHVDRIVVLDHGRILEEGTHADLLARGGHYAALYNTYFRHQSPDYRPGQGFVGVQVGA